MPQTSAEIYTDGSCHTQQRIGTWVAIVFLGTAKEVLSGTVQHTTHNRMELIAVIKGIQYVLAHYDSGTLICVYTDSQYVTSLPARKEKIVLQNFTTQKGNALQNAVLVKIFFELLSARSIAFIKIRAHQQQDDTINYNREADILCRKLLRRAVGRRLPGYS
ncbi:MAG TPA: RNase H family protein [Agriterribacter sp.]|nr:RNase H family protein [Agriterribacter sp.]